MFFIKDCHEFGATVHGAQILLTRVLFLCAEIGVTTVC